MNQFQVNASFGMSSETALNYIRYLSGGLEYDYESNSIVNQARTFRIANLARLDIAQDLLNGMQDAMTSGKGFNQFSELLTPILKKKGWWHSEELIDPDTGEIKENIAYADVGSPSRLKMIFDNLINNSYTIGNYVAMRKTVDAFPYWRYNAIDDEHTRPEHKKLNGKVFRWDDPIWKIILPPNGYNCRCYIDSLSEEDIKRLGITVLSSIDTSSYEVVDYIDEDGKPVMKKVQGVVFNDESGTEIVFYPDKGFDQNTAEAFFNVELDKYHTDLARQFVDAELSSPMAEMMHQNAIDNISTQDELNVAVLSEQDKETLGLSNKTVLLSQNALNTIMQNESLTLSDLRAIQHAILDAELVLNYQDTLCFCTQVKSGWQIIGISASGDVRTITTLKSSAFDLFVNASIIIRGSYE